MPEVSRFFGIVVRMFFDEHPPAHFHADYSEFSAVVGVQPIDVWKALFRPARYRWCWSGPPATRPG